MPRALFTEITRFLIDNGALVMSADVAKQLGEVLA